MKRTILIAIMFGIIGLCQADDYRTFTVTTHATTSSVAMTKYADPFTGEIDEISVYTPDGVTGAVAIAAIDPYSGNALVLATNAGVSTNMVWRPKITPPAIVGATALVVTNTSTDNRFNAHGEKIRAIVSAASTTSAVFRVFIKIKN